MVGRHRKEPLHGLQKSVAKTAKETGDPKLIKALETAAKNDPTHAAALHEAAEEARRVQAANEQAEAEQRQAEIDAENQRARDAFGEQGY